jgi:hypothetical protein
MSMETITCYHCLSANTPVISLAPWVVGLLIYSALASTLALVIALKHYL